MKTFNDYLRVREAAFLDKEPAEKDESSKDAVARIAQLGWDRYQEEVRDFFKSLADKDPDIRDEFQRLDSGKASDGNRFDRRERDTDDMDVVSPPEADVSPGYEAMSDM